MEITEYTRGFAIDPQAVVTMNRPVEINQPWGQLGRRLIIHSIRRATPWWHTYQNWRQTDDE